MAYMNVAATKAICEVCRSAVTPDMLALQITIVTLSDESLSLTGVA